MQTGKFANLIGRSGPNLVMAAGVVCLLVALFFPVPGDHLTTYKSLGNESGYSYIEEYVGGDAYNYITGAGLVGGHIAGSMATKSIFAVGGLVLLALGIGQANTQRAEQPAEAASEHTEDAAPKQPKVTKRNAKSERKTATVEEIKALKELLDAGAITEEEFSRKKSEFLGTQKPLLDSPQER